jgi:hypothetical protein
MHMPHGNPAGIGLPAEIAGLDHTSSMDAILVENVCTADADVVLLAVAEMLLVPVGTSSH